MKDLIILVADKNIQCVLEGLLPRHHALKICPVNFDVFVHPLRDPGVYRESADFLRPFQNQYQYALVFLDREGSGQEEKSARQIADEIKMKLEINGWKDRTEAIVFDPELEVWAWVQSQHLAVNTGWKDLTSLELFLRNQGYWENTSSKPHKPKEAFESALRGKRFQRSSSIYKKIASEASFQGCREPSFLKFKEVLRKWFLAE